MGDNGALVVGLLAGGSALVHLISRLLGAENRVLAVITTLVFVGSLGLLLAPSTAIAQAVDVGGVFEAHAAGVLLSAVSLILGALVSTFSGEYVAYDQRRESYYCLLLLMGAGIVGALLAGDVFVIYLSTVLSSASAYALVAFRRHTDTAVEAGFKYAIMGAMGSALVLFGIGFVYRESGELLLPEVMAAGQVLSPLGPGLIVAGYAIKSALVPAHTWLPDAHGRAPSSVSAMLSGIYIETNLCVMIRLGLMMGWSPRAFGLLLVLLALLNMTVGNLMALRQSYGKRLLAYSSVAQVGYMLLAFGLGLIGLGLMSGSQTLIAAGLFLVVAHAWMKGLAFLVKGILHHYYDATLLDDLDGMAARVPLTAGLFCVALAGLAGIPPLAGFLGKWQLVVGALETVSARDTIVVSVALVAFILNNLIALGYYLPLMGRLFVRRGAMTDEVPHGVAVSPWMSVPTLVLAGLVVICGVWPGPILAFARQAAEQLLGGL